MDVNERAKKFAEWMIRGEACTREVFDFIVCHPDPREREFIRGVAVRLGYRCPAGLDGRRPAYVMRVPGEDLHAEGREAIRNRKAGYAFASEALDLEKEKVNLAAEEFEVAIEGAVYCAPCRPGCVAPAGFRDEFRARGTIAEIGRAWEAWCNTPTRSARGDEYPRRYIGGPGKHPRDHIIDELIRRYGGTWGYFCGDVSRLLRDRMTT